MSEKNVQVLDALDRIMRLLKRGGPHPPHHGRASGRILQIVSEQPGISTRELAEVLDVRPSSLNEALGRMEEHEVIRRERGKEDQRTYCIFLTEDGQKRLEQQRKDREEFTAKVNSLLSEDEMEQFLFLAGKFADSLENIVPNEEERPPHPIHRGRAH